MTKQTFPVTGMSCASCAVSVESTLKSLDGVRDAGVNFANNSAYAEYDSESISLEALQKAIRDIGYNLIIETEDPYGEQEKVQQEEYKRARKRFLGSTAFAFPVFVIGMFFPQMPYAAWISLILTIPVLFIFGWHFFRNSLKLASHGQTNMDTLVALSTGIAFAFSAFNTIYPQFFESRGFVAHIYFEAAAVIIAFISLGKWLEEKAKNNTSASLKKLMNLQPKNVKVIHNEKEIELPVGDVEKGQIVMVRPGEKIPLDGEVTIGSSFVDESMISGEPQAVKKAKGDEVFAGTINQKGAFRFATTKVGDETLLAQIIKTVREAQGSKAPVQKMADKVAGIFVPAVILIAILTFASWMIFGGENAFTHALITSISVLVIACPCALGLATPTAIMVGVGKGAENGILIKDAESLELAHQVDTVVLDKTGTITKGSPQLLHQLWLVKDESQEKFKAILYHLETQSEHPLAQAVVNAFKDLEAKDISLNHFNSLSGRGVEAATNEHNLLAGNLELMQENKVTIPTEVSASIEKWLSEANTVIYFAVDGKLTAILAIADAVKDSSAAAVASLQNRGLEVHMLTGDNEKTAKAVAAQVSIKNVKAGVLPQQKAEYVKQLQQKGRKVAMVGDGINDSTALAQADVSIAMGKGTDIAMDVARMTLISSDLSILPSAFELSKKTVAGIRQNLFWAFIYNIIGIPIAAGILYPFTGFLLNPMVAGAAMAFSSLSVVLNSLRLRSVKI